MILLTGKSLSKLGKDLDGQKYYHKEQEPKESRTRNNLEKRIHREFNKITKNTRHRGSNPTFNTVSREVKSSFTMRNTKDSVENKYTPAFENVKPHVFGCSISKTEFKHEFDNIRNYQTPATCRRHSTSEELDISRARQKSLHHLDFNKQSPKKFHSQLPDPDMDPQLRFNNFQSSTLPNRGRAFSSYTKRTELFTKTVHPLMINLREVKTHLFRKGWSPQKVVPFDKLNGKVNMRSDKKIEERVSEFNTRSTDYLGSNKFSDRSTYVSQTERKPNTVKSQYHFRMCL